MKDNEFQKCRCGHPEDTHNWKKDSTFDQPYLRDEFFDLRPWSRSVEIRSSYKEYSCTKFNPRISNQTKLFGIGIVVFVVVAIISKVFLS